MATAHRWPPPGEAASSAAPPQRSGRPRPRGRGQLGLGRRPTRLSAAPPLGGPSPVLSHPGRGRPSVLSEASHHTLLHTQLLASRRPGARAGDCVSLGRPTQALEALLGRLAGTSSAPGPQCALGGEARHLRGNRPPFTALRRRRSRALRSGGCPPGYLHPGMWIYR